MPRVEVIYALPQECVRRVLDLPAGTTVREAIEASGVLEAHPGIDLAASGAAIFGRRVALDHVPGDGDRVEILRPLLADPKTARRRRALGTRR